MGPYWPKLGGLCVLFNSSPTSEHSHRLFYKKSYLISDYRFKGFNLFQVLKLLFCSLVTTNNNFSHKIYCKNVVNITYFISLILF